MCIQKFNDGKFKVDIEWVPDEVLTQVVNSLDIANKLKRVKPIYRNVLNGTQHDRGELDFAIHTLRDAGLTDAPIYRQIKGCRDDLLDQQSDS